MIYGHYKIQPFPFSDQLYTRKLGDPIDDHPFWEDVVVCVKFSQLIFHNNCLIGIDESE